MKHIFGHIFWGGGCETGPSYAILYEQLVIQNRSYRKHLFIYRTARQLCRQFCRCVLNRFTATFCHSFKLTELSRSHFSMYLYILYKFISFSFITPTTDTQQVRHNGYNVTSLNAVQILATTATILPNCLSSTMYVPCRTFCANCEMNTNIKHTDHC